jgi:hypothetical protein
VGDDVLVREETPQLLEGALAPHRLVPRRLDRPERVVGDAEQHGERALGRQLDEQLDDPDEALEVLDDLEAGRRAVARVAQRGADGGQARVGGEVGPDRHDLAGGDLAGGLLERLGAGVHEHRPGRPGRAQRGGRGDALAAAEVQPDGRLAYERRGERVAQLVLDPDRGMGVPRDPLLPFGHGRAAYTQRA